MIEYFNEQKGRHNQTEDAISKIGLDNVLLSAIPDALIAATALETNLKLYTYNQKDFKFIKGLKLHKVRS